VTPTQLDEHLRRDHGRSVEEVGSPSARDLHRLEHLEHALGLIALDHVHPPEPARSPTAGAAVPLH
jgi:hypothetical protein